MALNAVPLPAARLIEFEVELRNHGDQILQRIEWSIDAIETFKRDPKYLEKLLEKRAEVGNVLKQIETLAKGLK